MDKRTLIISMPKGSTQEEIAAIRSKYKNQYNVNIIISGNTNPQTTIENFLKARLETYFFYMIQYCYTKHITM